MYQFDFAETFQNFIQSLGFTNMTWQQGVMLLVSFVLIYLAIAKKYEPLLLLTISFGILLTNLPMAGMYHPELWQGLSQDISYSRILHELSLIHIFAALSAKRLLLRF